MDFSRFFLLLLTNAFENDIFTKALFKMKIIYEGESIRKQMEDGSSIPLWGSLIFIIILFFNGILYGFSAAIQNLSAAETEKKAAEGNEKAKKLLRMMENSNIYSNCIPFTVILTGSCFGTFFVPYLTTVLSRYIQIPKAAVLLVLLFSTIILAGFGVLTFRRIGYYHTEFFAYKTVNLVAATTALLFPFSFVITWIARFTAIIFGIDLQSTNAEVTEEEILSVVGEAHEQGVIEENEAEMIQNIISFNETDAREIMTHRSNLIAFEKDTLLEEVVTTMLEEGNSRYPVYEESLDNILGIVYYKDVMSAVMANQGMKKQTLEKIPSLIRKVNFIPETRSIGDIFKSMQAKQFHMAVVVDEYGQTSGVVTMEDILEEIVGDIWDEYDEEDTSIQAQIDNSILIEGLTNFYEVGEELGTNFEDLDFETLNGYLTSLLGHIPTEEDIGQILTAKGYQFEILSIDHKTIERVRAEKIAQEEKKGKEETCQDIQNSQI